MANTYNYLSNVYQKVKKEVLNDPLVALVSLVFLTLPLPHIFNSISAISLALFCGYKLKSNKFILDKTMFLPIVLYLIMILSLFWSIDLKTTLNALTKEIPLLIFPLCFCIVPVLKDQKKQIVNNFGYIILGYTFFYLLKAILRFIISKDATVFFYHELVTLDVNAIHVSVYCALAFFIFLIKKNKVLFDKIAIFTLALFIFLLSSKNVIITFIVLLTIYGVFFSNKKLKKSEIGISILSVILFSIIFYNKAKERFLIEIDSNTQEISLNKENESRGLVVYNVNIKDAWNKDKFSYNDFFPGTALRVYQIRIFTEMLHEDNIFFTGYGLNASWKKIKEKRIQHNLYPEYEKFNFHNQYIQNFAELGVFGFLLLVIILVITLRNSLKTKDFIHFSFAVLMISLFLTESFLWRQRGVIFFTLFYCLFNAELYKNDSTKIE